jgi:Dolichyl-phosphate-mannose-protein mannosyltransferase
VSAAAPPTARKTSAVRTPAEGRLRGAACVRMAGITGAAASGGCTQYDTFFLERDRRGHFTLTGIDRCADPSSMADISSPPPLVARERRALLATVGLSLLFSTWSIWWGLPGMPESWAPDEFSPLRIHHGIVQRFSNGWFELYPPFHVYLLALAVSPLELFAPRGLSEMADPASYAAAFYLMRLVSVAMAAGLVVVVFELGRELFDARSGLFAALIVALMVPLAYYGKLANVEVPYLFWFALSLLFYIRILAGHRMTDYVAFALAAAFAIGTKDQAYGFYLAVPFTIAASDAILRRQRGMPAPLWRSAFNRRTLAVLATGAIALALVHNVLFNWSGAVERLRIMTGPTTQTLQEFPDTVAGHAAMLALAVRHVQFALGWPLFAASLAGLAIIARHWRQHPRAMALLPPIVTYWIFLILPIMYHYDRYLLPVAVILAVFGGVALARLTHAGGRFIALRQGIAIASVAYSIACAASLNVLLAGDARYAAERWLGQNLTPRSRVMAVGYAMYLPRFDNLDVVTCLRPTLAMLPDAPDYLVLSSFFEEWRFADDPEALEFFKALKAGRTPYQLAFSYRARPALNLVDVRGVRTNLDKINPRIRVYRRAPD